MWYDVGLLSCMTSGNPRISANIVPAVTNASEGFCHLLEMLQSVPTILDKAIRS